MPVRYEIDKQLGLILIVGSAVIRDEDSQELTERLLADPDLRHCSMELDDWRAVTRNEVSVECIRSVAESWANFDPHLEGAKLASVTAREVDFGVSRMYQGIRNKSPVEIRVFRELSQAELWLGLPAGFVDSRVAPEQNARVQEPSGERSG